jgi:iron(III) transport system permease protein
MWMARIIVLLAVTPLAVAVVAPLCAGEPWGYAWWWGTARGWLIFSETLEFAVLAALVGTVAGWMIAWDASRLTPRGAAMVVIASCLPLLLPASLLGTAWIMALGRDGWLTGWVPGDGSWTIYRRPVAAAAVGLRYVGLAVLVFLPACRKQRESRPVEAAFQIPLVTRLVHLRVRPAVPRALAAITLLTLIVANDHVFPGMFLINTYGVQVLIQLNALLDEASAAALAMPMLLVAASIAGTIRWLDRGPRRPGDSSTHDLRGVPHPAAWPGPVRALPFTSAGVLLLAVGIPLAALVARCGSWVTLSAAWDACRPERWRTAHLAALGGVLCAAGAVAPAACWVRAGMGERWIVAALAVLVLAPSSLSAVGVMGIFDRAPFRIFRDSDAPIMLAYFCRFLPIAVVLLAGAWMKIDRSSLDAARAHGVGAWRLFRSVACPIYGPALVAAAMLCALLIAAELEMSLLLIAPGTTTLGVRLHSMIHTAPDALVSAAALTVLAAVAVGGLLAVVLGACLMRGWRWLS